MGGLARRVSYLKAFKLRSNREVPTFFVDAGNIFSDERFSAGQIPSDVMSKNKWVVKAYGDFRHDAANINYADLPYITELFKKEGFDSRVEELPFIKKLVSANVQPIDDAHLAPAPYVIREVTLTRSMPGHTIRVGIVGFTEAKPTGPNPENRETVRGGYRIDDPFEAAKRILPELKLKCDFIIALAYMPSDMSQKLATENPEIDTIIGARQINNTEDLQHYNRATVVYAYNQTKHLGELRMYVKPDGSIDKQVNRFVALDSVIPDDPSAVDIVTTAHNEFTSEQNKAQEKSSPSQPSLLGGAESAYVGVDTCSGCHQGEFQIWQKTGHAHAMATLEKKNQQFDTECVRCHVVGFSRGGFQSLTSTPHLANVQCESCHGPGREHSMNPRKGYGLMSAPSGCVVCHTLVNSPDFNFAAYWPKVKHGAGEAAPD